MNPKRRAEQKKLNSEARTAMRSLSRFRAQCATGLKPLMWKYDYETLMNAIKMVRLELRNQTLTQEG
jgi:hypothetical protein